MTRPLMSVCVAAYNHDRYIQQCLLSVISQRYEVELEILVGDDASTDNTAKIVESIDRCYPGVIRFFHHEKNLGAAGNYQYLIERAQGDFIAHIDGDDYWLPGKLASQLAFLEEHAECAAVYTNAVVISEGGELLGSFHNQCPEVLDLDFLLEKGNFLNHSSLCYPSSLRDCILSITGAFIDYRVHLRLAHSGKLGLINRVLSVYRYGSITSMMKNDSERVRQLYWEALLDVQAENAHPGALAGAVASFWQPILMDIVRHGNITAAYRWSQRIMKESPSYAGHVLLLVLSRMLRPAGRGLLKKTGRMLSGDRLRVFHER